MGTVRTLIGTGLGDSQVRSRLTIRLHALVERFFPERRLFLRSDSDTRFIRLRSETQAVGFAGLTLLVGWSIVATSILLMDSIGAGNFRDQAKRDQETYQHRLNALSAERDARAAEALTRVGLGDRMFHRPFELSGGQQQRLGIARALVMRPKLLILDEPKLGIQPSIIKDIHAVLELLKERGNMAIMLVEQYVEFAKNLGEQYVVLDRGEGVLSGLNQDMDEEQVRSHIAV